MHCIENPALQRDNNPTFFGDICVEYDTWCKDNCAGKYEINNVSSLEFELLDDLEKFHNTFWKAIIITTNSPN